MAQRQCSVIFPSVTDRCWRSRPDIWSFLLQETALGSCKCRPNPLLSAKSSLDFLFHPSQASARLLFSIQLRNWLKPPWTGFGVCWDRVSASLLGRIRPRLLFSFPPSRFPRVTNSNSVPLPLPPVCHFFFTLPWAKASWNRLNSLIKEWICCEPSAFITLPYFAFLKFII